MSVIEGSPLIFGFVQLALHEACGRQVDAGSRDLGDRLTALGENCQVAQRPLSCLLRLLAAAEVEPCRRRAGFAGEAAARVGFALITGSA